MKTRKKTVKTPTKGRRRSSVIVVKKSPIRRNQRRNLRIPNKYSILSDYESPLRSLKDNGELKPSTSTSPLVKEECMKEEHIEEMDQDQKPIHLSVATKCNPTEVVKQEKVVKDNSSSEQNDSTQDSMAENDDRAPSKSQKRNVSTFVASHDKPNPKKRKLKKSPLSRLNESKELNSPSETIIILDDSMSEPTTAINKTEKKHETIKDILASVLEESSDSKSVSNTTFTGKIKDTKSVVDTVIPHQNNTSKLAVNPVSNHFESLQSNSKPVRSEDVLEIDSNDTLMEMEAYHNAFNQSADSPPTCSNFADSVIVIDPDDDEDNVNNVNTDKSPAQKINEVAKPLEDCFVVWSSLPSTSTSITSSSTTTGTPTFSANPLHNNNLDILKFDKILIDTNAEFSNLRFLNNENNKPRKNQFKSPKNVKGVKKPLLKTAMDKAKTPVKNSAKGASKSVDKTTNGFLARAAAKASTKVVSKATAKVVSRTPTKTAVKPKTKTTCTTTVKKKSKSNGQLIFSSESKEDGENKTAKKKNMKGKLREIVIDGCNVAMAYNHNKIFSEKGIKMCIDYFTKRGHVVKVFIPQSRRSLKFPLLEKWFNEGIVVFTPSRKIGNKFITSYDDRYILEYAAACGGIVVSQDQFRDLYAEKQEYRDTIENRMLVPTFVGDYVMFPEDPLGRDGPSLIDFLKH